MYRRASLWTNLGIALVLSSAVVTGARAAMVRLQDISQIQGMRDNQLVGYGLVVGLAGTGDSRASAVTSRSMANMLEKFGLDSTQRDFATRNSAAVMVTATLGAAARNGDRVDVTIASIGDAKSLQGGTLILTPLYAGNQKVYAQAQGPVSVGGYYAGQSSQSIVKNVTTAGTIPGGAIVERDVLAEFVQNNRLVLTLERADFSLAQRVVQELNQKYGASTAKSADGKNIEAELPAEYQNDPVRFLAEVQTLTVEPGSSARVIIDERTGTVVVGGDVKISKVAVTHGGLHVAVAGEKIISQPNPFSKGRTVVAEQLSLSADEEKGNLVTLPEGSNIESLVKALNTLGTLPRDIIVILQNLKAAGALHGEIIAR